MFIKTVKTIIKYVIFVIYEFMYPLNLRIS